MKKFFLTAVAGALLVFSAAAPPADDIRRDSTVLAIEKVMPSVVNIRTETLVERSDLFSEYFRQFFGGRQQPQNENSLGSGVIIDEDGYILTNLHVVNRASRVTVILSSGKAYEAERYIGSARTDVALLKLKTKPGEKFAAVKFASDDDLLLGETVIALGNPFGLGGSVSRGILSSKRRVAPKANQELYVPNWLQTDAAINPGNSGGPLINLKGELIGVNVAMLPDAQGIGFAIPVKDVSEALSELFTPETSERKVWFGARFKPGSSPPVVSYVLPDSPAERGGLRVGDKVVQVNGKIPRRFVEVSEFISSANSVNMVVQRGNERVVVKQVLPTLTEVIRERLGAELQELNPEVAAALEIEAGTGLLLERVDRAGPAAQATLQPGFILNGIDEVPVNNLLDAANLLAQKRKGSTVRCSILVPVTRNGQLVSYRRALATIKLR